MAAPEVEKAELVVDRPVAGLQRERAAVRRFGPGVAGRAVRLPESEERIDRGGLRGERALRDPIRDQARMLELKPFADALVDADARGVADSEGWQALRWDLRTEQVVRSSLLSPAAALGVVDGGHAVAECVAPADWPNRVTLWVSAPRALPSAIRSGSRPRAAE